MESRNSMRINQLALAAFCVMAMRSWVVSAVLCYDSPSRTNPGTVVNCSGVDQRCYSEFYSLRDARDPHRIADWHVDRFCVHERQCRMRGIGASCATIAELDRTVRRTFKHKLNKLHHGAYNRLAQSRFCCCADDFCNRLDRPELKRTFNISVVATPVVDEVVVLAAESDGRSVRSMSANGVANKPMWAMVVVAMLLCGRISGSAL